MRTFIKLTLLPSVFILTWGCCFLLASHLVAQEANDDLQAEEEQSPPAFGSFGSATVTLRLNGEEIVYSSQVFIPNPDEMQGQSLEEVQKTFKVPVSVTVEVDGELVTEYRIIEETRTYTVCKKTGGTYEQRDIAIPADSVFLSLDGNEVDRMSAMRTIGMRKLPVLLLPKGMEIPSSWEQVLKPDTLILRITGPLEGQTEHTFYNR